MYSSSAFKQGIINWQNLLFICFLSYVLFIIVRQIIGSMIPLLAGITTFCLIWGSPVAVLCLGLLSLSVSWIGNINWPLNSPFGFVDLFRRHRLHKQICAEPELINLNLNLIAHDQYISWHRPNSTWLFSLLTDFNLMLLIVWLVLRNWPLIRWLKNHYRGSYIITVI